jgi:hypothetical protein
MRAGPAALLALLSLTLVKADLGNVDFHDGPSINKFSVVIVAAGQLEAPPVVAVDGTGATDLFVSVAAAVPVRTQNMAAD